MSMGRHTDRRDQPRGKHFTEDHAGQRNQHQEQLCVGCGQPQQADCKRPVEQLCEVCLKAVGSIGRAS